MISNEKEPTTVNREKEFFINTIKYLKEKPERLITTIIGSIIATLFFGSAIRFFVRNSEHPVANSIIVYIICFISVLIFAYLFWRKKILPRIEINTGTKDEREFKYSDEHPYGTARPNTAEDLDDILEFKDIKDTYGTILGYDDRVKKVVSIPTIEEFAAKAKERNWTQDDKTNNSRNRNALIIGSPGTMKSRAVIMNEIFQSIRAGESIIVTDPKGDLYEKTYNILKDNGYDVKMFNLINQENSDASNLVSELNNDSTYAKIFAETLVNNADEDGEKFWNNNAMNFIKACLMLDSIDTLGKLYDFVSGNTLNQFDEIFSDRSTNKVAQRAYAIFNQCNEQVKGQIINGLGIMIDVFQDDKVRNITNTNEMDLTKPAREKCAYFVITSDQHRTFDYLAVLFWTMAFIKLVEYIDKNRDEKGDPTTNPVHLLLDEFPNIGAIPDFNRKLSTVRSRLLYSTIVIQNIPQLMNRYPNGMHEEIFSDCDFVVFLGCNDNTTAEYISKLTGIASIEVMTENHTYDNEKLALNQSAEMRKVKSIGQRTVQNPDEVRSIYNTDLLIFIRGIKSVYQCKKYDYSKHPFNKDLKVCKIADHIPEWRQKQIDEENEKIRIAEERKQARELEEKRKAEIIRKAKEVDAAKKKAQEDTLRAEETEWLNQFGTEQIDFENLTKSYNDFSDSETTEVPETEDSEKFDTETSNVEMSNLDELNFSVNETDEGLFNDTDSLFASMNDKPKSNNKPPSRGRRKVIKIDDETSDKTVA